MQSVPCGGSCAQCVLSFLHAANSCVKRRWLCLVSRSKMLFRLSVLCPAPKILFGLHWATVSKTFLNWSTLDNTPGGTFLNSCWIYSIYKCDFRLGVTAIQQCFAKFWSIDPQVCFLSSRKALHVSRIQSTCFLIYTRTYLTSDNIFMRFPQMLKPGLKAVCCL